MEKSIGCLGLLLFLLVPSCVVHAIFFYQGPEGMLAETIKSIENGDIEKTQSLMCNDEVDLEEATSEIRSIGKIEKIKTDYVEREEATATYSTEVKNFYDHSTMYTSEHEKKIGVTYERVSLIVDGERGKTRFYGQIWPSKGHIKLLKEENRSTSGHKRSGDCVASLRPF